MSVTRKGREAAIQMLYQVEDGHVLTGDPSVGITRFLENFDHDAGSIPEAETLVRGVCSRAALVDGLIEKHARNWKLSRMAKVDRNILRLAVYELAERKDTPTRVAINEAIELGKRFGSENSSGFINGVLDPVAREVRGGS
jgi:N utilization substance protein B